MALAIFDLDNTLIHGDSDFLWGQFLIHKNAVDPAFYEQANHRFHQDYLNGTLDILQYQRFSLSPLTHYDMATLNDWRSEFVRDWIEPIYQPRAQEAVDAHRQNGDTLLIITATNSFITGPIGHLYGIDNLIGTDPEIVDDRFTGEITGTPSFQAGKITRLHEWLQDRSETLTGSHFYSDSHNDLPLLEQVSHPFVVDGDETLLTEARKREWPCLSFHQDQASY
jgi:HAD superfamily hydrolase (TIGR01490 family)